jgi:protocatechuate 3,4-dioxygenase beta subunit
MDRIGRLKLTRRELRRIALALPAPLGIALMTGKTAGIAFAQTSDPADASPTAVLAPTPDCDDGDDLGETLRQTEGPFYSPESPERTSLLEPGMPGREIYVTGYVYSTNCEPVANALIDFWQANDAGEYDNTGYTLRGHQFTGPDGRFELTTILPGLYPGRTRHIHVKLQAPNNPVLTTQLYFPGVAENESDGIFDPSLEMDLQTEDGRDVGFFTFVLDVPDED